MSYSEIRVFSGRLSEYLCKQICANLHIHVGNRTIRNFSDGEIWVKYNENIRGQDAYLVQSTPPNSDNLMELLIMIDAARRASATRITAVIPYFGYARQDRKDQPRVAITAKLMANLITQSGADRIITMDLHAPQIQGFFDIPVDHLYCSVLFLKYFKHLKIKNLSVSATDVGGTKRARVYANELGADEVAALHKLQSSGATLLNQSVLLKGINDSSAALIDLSKRLYEAGVLPYYLHMLDPVQGAMHFDVSRSRAVDLMASLRKELPGYLVPRLVRENPGEVSKTAIFTI